MTINYNPKVNSLRSLMSSPSLFKIIKEGLEAPLGSTKRNKARSVLMASTKIRNNFYNGQGGGVYYGPQTGSMTSLLQPAGMANRLNTTYNQPISIAQPRPVTPTPNIPVEPAQTSNQDLTVQPAIPQKRDVVIGFPLPSTLAPTTPTAPAPTEQGIVPPYGGTPEGLVKWKEEKPEEFQSFRTTVDAIGTPLASNERPLDIPSALWNEVQTAVENKVGKETWRNQMLPKLKSYFPDVPEEELPLGAMWTDGLPALEKRLREENGLDSKLAYLQKIQGEGLTIEEDLQTFIRSKDQYLSSVNQMISNVDDIWTGGDPALENIKNKYQKFLYIQKARQNMKYDNYVKTSIKEFEAKQKRLTDDYNTAVSAYKEELSQEKIITQDRFNYYKGMLEDLYSNIDERQKNINDTNNATIEAINNEKEMADLVIEQSGGIPLTDSDKNNSLTNYIKLNSDKTPATAEAEWKLLSDSEKRMYIKTEEGINEDDVMFYVTQIGAYKKGQDTAYVDENGNVKWASVPQDLRTAVLNKLKELAAQQQKNTTPGSSIWNKLSKIIGGGLGQPLSILGIPLIKNK